MGIVQVLFNDKYSKNDIQNQIKLLNKSYNVHRKELSAQENRTLDNFIIQLTNDITNYINSMLTEPIQSSPEQLSRFLGTWIEEALDEEEEEEEVELNQKTVHTLKDIYDNVVYTYISTESKIRLKELYNRIKSHEEFKKKMEEEGKEYILKEETDHDQ